MLPIFFATYGAVFLAEIVGDKLLYTTGVLAARYRTAPVMFGMALAFMLKMGVAVLVGKAISTLPPLLVASITALSFLGVAYALWRKPAEKSESRKDHAASKAALVSFATIFFSEWETWAKSRRRQCRPASAFRQWSGRARSAP
jgi:putative Ca2+/H+ antiporter (TMEM165/GDT1 family)